MLKLIQWRWILELEDKWELNAKEQDVCVGQCVWLGVHLWLEQLFDKSGRSWEGKRGSQKESLTGQSPLCPRILGLLLTLAAQQAN